MATITTTEMAKLTGYDVSTITNWKRRYSDFPHVVEKYGRTEVFDQLEFTNWWETHEARKRK